MRFCAASALATSRPVKPRDLHRGGVEIEHHLRRLAAERPRDARTLHRDKRGRTKFTPRSARFLLGQSLTRERELNDRHRRGAIIENQRRRRADRHLLEQALRNRRACACRCDIFRTSTSNHRRGVSISRLGARSDGGAHHHPIRGALTTTVNDIEHIEANSYTTFGIVKISFIRRSISLRQRAGHGDFAEPAQADAGRHDAAAGSQLWRLDGADHSARASVRD